MEAIEARALKPSLRRQISMKSTQQALLEDLWAATNGINSVAGEDLFVDDLLDLSNGNFEDGSVEEDEEEKDSLSDSSSQDNENSNSFNFPSTDDFGSLPSDGLAVPVDDLADLEWLSHFVDDSISEFSLLCPSGKEKPENRPEKRVKTGSRPASLRHPCFPTPVPAKARTKRPRSTGRVWSLGSPSLTESSSSSSSSSGSYSSTPCLLFTNSAQTMEFLHSLGKPPAKKQKKRPAVQAGESGGHGGNQFQRRCSHCQVQKTPQWRTGPLGAKTLCNACGVRYKSGRLFPEYRPACSPTFSSEVHSNSHRKVLEMRRKKENNGPESGLAQMVSSF
ncbi:hypothetical protein L1049_015316 [Liquidambar formosana]|uniref:GATA transcription factor n=1 Tax=Liquidambar formosana TaxID=63359 RepID=A0AAP0S425_LIQFO